MEKKFLHLIRNKLGSSKPKKIKYIELYQTFHLLHRQLDYFTHQENYQQLIDSDLESYQNMCRINRSDLYLLKLNFKNPIISKTKGTLVKMSLSHCHEIYNKSNRLSPYKLPGNFFTSSNYKIKECKEILKKYIKFENKNFIFRNMKNLFKNSFRLTDSDTLRLKGIRNNSLISWQNGITM